MDSVVRRISKRIRHLPGIENCDALWNAVRGPYHRLLNAAGGVEITASCRITIRIPAEYAGHDWENYEPEAVSRVADWAHKSGRGLLVDVGSALGIFSAVALFANPNIEVIACESDLASLAATRRFCQYAFGRLRLLHGFVTNAGSGDTASQAEARTDLALVQSAPSGDIGTTRYVCLGADGHDTPAIPRNALDDLLREERLDGRSILIKCDVEGAELLVLQGARDTLARHHPTLLVSVHPWAMPQHGHTKEMLSDFLTRLGYGITLIAVDHEEHWWCSTSESLVLSAP